MILRAVALLLVCLNLGAAVWWWLHVPTSRVTPEPALPAGVARLQMLSERPESPLASPAAVGDCRSIGPFDSIDALRAAMHRLEPQVERIQLRELPHLQLVGYRVYLPPAPSRETALTRTAQLAARGIRDYYLVTAGAQENTIALGLFRELGNAERRRDELKAKGFAAVLEPRSEEGLRWWIDLVAAADFDWRAALGTAVTPALDAQPCAGTAAAEPAAVDDVPAPDAPEPEPTR